MRIMNKKLLGFLLLPLLLVIPNSAYSTPLFGVPTQLDPSGPIGGSRDAVSGNNVFSTWIDQCGDLWYARSTDDGDSFTTNAFPISGDSVCFGLTSNGRVAATGSNVHVAWVDQGGVDTGIFIQNSVNDGLTFNGGLDFTDGSAPFPAPATQVSTDTPSSLEISATGDYLYVVWVDGSNNVQLAASNDNGITFSPFSLGAAAASAIPVVTSSGDDAFVAWQDSSNDIFVKKITFDSGTSTFDDSATPQNLSGTGMATQPKIVATGSNVYVSWEDSEFGDSEIYFSNSADSGVTFNGGSAGTPGVPVNLSSNTGESVQPDIAATGSNVFVVWRDNQFAGSTNYEILLQSSSDNSATFNGGIGTPGVPVNLSGNNGDSASPKISANGSEAYVVWQDGTFDSGDILFRTILNNGNTVGGIKNISQSPVMSILPQVASSSSNVSTVWDDFSQVAVSFNHALPNDVDVSLDQAEYLQGDAATITVIAPTGSGPIPVDVTSDSDGTGFTIDAIEIGSTGVYTAEITFTPTLGGTDSASAILEAIPGDQIFITEPLSGQTTFASIVSSAAISFAPVTTAYDRGAIAHVTVTDASANTNPAVAESVTVDVTSTTQVGSTPLTLQETGPNTGIFGNTANNKLIFITSSDSLLPENSEITITQQHTGADITPGVDTISEAVLSTSDPAGITLTLTETGGSTGIFTGVLTISSVGSIAGSTILAPPGDIVQVIRGSAISNALVTPNTNNVGAVLVNADPLTDTVTVSYGASTASADVEKQFASGGGGGGISRAGLVVNLLGGTIAPGDRNVPGNLAFGKSSFAIISGGDQGFGGILDQFSATTFDQTKTFKVGEKAVIRFDFTERGGIGKIEHIGLFANIRDGQKKYDSDTFIIYNPIKSQQATIHDPNGLFSKATFDLLQKDATNFVLKYDLTFAKPMAKSDLILESWNAQKQLSTNKIANAIEVVSSGIVQEQTTPAKTTFTEDITNDKVIPVWVKSNAKWWADGKLDNQNFISGLEYLVNEGIIKVSSTNTSDGPTSTSDSPTITEIQPWIKSTAGWWADDKISENEFVTAIQWLITNNIIQVAA